MSDLHEKAWIAECDRRAEEVRAGRAHGAPWDEAYARLQARLQTKPRKLSLIRRVLRAVGVPEWLVP